MVCYRGAQGALKIRWTGLVWFGRSCSLEESVSKMFLQDESASIGSSCSFLDCSDRVGELLGTLCDVVFEDVVLCPAQEAPVRSVRGWQLVGKRRSALERGASEPG